MDIKLNGYLTEPISSVSESHYYYLNLDLSDCITDNKDFIANELFSENVRNRIVSLILPDCFETIHRKSDDMFVYKDLPILQSITGKNILSIDNYAFQGCNTLLSIDFPKATKISDCAFQYNRKLKTVNLPNVKNLGEFSFAGCSSLISLKLLNVTKIDDYAFFYCNSIKSIEVNNVISIGKGAFEGCESLESIDLPNIHGVDKTVFKNCNSLKTVNLFMKFIEEFMPEVCKELFD